MMRRRTLLKWLAALPIPALRAWAQTANFPGNYSATLRDLAAVVLPSELGPTGIDHVATRFEHWVRDYRPSAEMDHGYGFPRLRTKPPTPGVAYIAQLELLRRPLADPDKDARRKAVETELDHAGVKDLPRSPDGKHIASDLMSFYFNSADANDLCYRVRIQRDTCRGLEGSENPPPPLRRGA